MFKYIQFPLTYSLQCLFDPNKKKEYTKEKKINKKKFKFVNLVGNGERGNIETTQFRLINQNKINASFSNHKAWVFRMNQKEKKWYLIEITDCAV